MCTKLIDLFSCLRTTKENGEESTATTKKSKRSKGETPVVVTESPTSPELTPPTACVRPTPRDARVSYEAMERYDQIFGAPAGSEPGISTSDRNVPDQF